MVLLVIISENDIYIHRKPWFQSIHGTKKLWTGKVFVGTLKVWLYHRGSHSLNWNPVRKPLLWIESSVLQKDVFLTKYLYTSQPLLFRGLSIDSCNRCKLIVLLVILVVKKFENYYKIKWNGSFECWRMNIHETL